MRSLMLALSLLVSGAALATPKEVLRQNLDDEAQGNLVENPGFENGAARWEPNDDAELEIRTTDPGYGLRSGSWDPDETSDNLDSVQITVPPSVGLKNCEASVQYLYQSGSDGDITLQVLQDGSSVLASDSLLQDSIWKDSRLEFVCPADGTSLELRFDNNIAAAGSLFIDQAYIGKRTTSPVKVVDESSSVVIVSADLANLGGTTCAVNGEIGGDWLDNDNITENGSGDCTYTINTGVFSAFPFCVCSSAEGAKNINCDAEASSATSLRVETGVTTTAAGVNAQVNVVCMGNK